MADKLITCSTCGTKNALHRTVCLSCGSDLSASKGGTKVVSKLFVKWVRSLAKNFSTPTQWSIAALFVVAVYFGLTWFFFGSSHPCGILEARQKPYVVNRYTDNAITLLSMVSKNYMSSQKFYEEMFMRGILEKEAAATAKESQKQFDRALQDLSDAPKNAARDLHQKISNHYTPAKCLWEGLAWNPDPYKGSPPLKDILKVGQ